MDTKLQNHGGKFISLSFKDGKKIKKVCAKILTIGSTYFEYADVNSKEVKRKKISSLV